MSLLKSRVVRGVPREVGVKAETSLVGELPDPGHGRKSTAKKRISCFKVWSQTWGDLQEHMCFSAALEQLDRRVSQWPGLKAERKKPQVLSHWSHILTDQLSLQLFLLPLNFITSINFTAHQYVTLIQGLMLMSLLDKNRLEKRTAGSFLLTSLHCLSWIWCSVNISWMNQ